ncbi:DNA methyltransferase [Glycomyces sp. NPDC047369]
MASPRRRRWPSIWATGQTQPRHQRTAAYVAGGRHPAKMWPAIARTAIGRYSAPGDLVFDPMCGIGTTLVEAVLAGRSAIGADLDPVWVGHARANTAAALGLVPGPTAAVFAADATNLESLLDEHGLRSRVDLVVTSPPYGAVTHGQPDTARVTGGAIRNRHHRYHQGKQRATLATSSLPRLAAGLERVFAGCFAALRPGGLMVVTSRPFTEQRQLVDFPSLVVRAALAAGFVVQERCVALLSRWDGHELHPHATFFHLANTRALRGKGAFRVLRAHEDVLVLRRPA